MLELKLFSYVLYIFKVFYMFILKFMYFLKRDSHPFLSSKIELLSKHWDLEVGVEADISQTHPPSRIKVAFGQGFVIIGIRIREGPLRHDARNKPAEQGKKRIYVEIRAKAALGRRRPAPGEHLPSSPSATARSWRFEWTPGPPRPSRLGVAPPQKGCQGS